MPTLWSIRKNLLLLILAVTLPLLGWVLFSLHDNARHALQDAQAASLRLTEIVAADTARLVAVNRNLLEGLARRPRIQALTATDCDPILADFNQFFTNLANVAVADRNGDVVCSARPYPAHHRPSVADAAWFKTLRERNAFSVGTPHVGPISGSWVAVLAQPLRDAAGNFNGIVGFPLELKKFRPFPEHVSLPDETLLYIVDDAGIVVSRSSAPDAWIGQAFPLPDLLAQLPPQGSGSRSYEKDGKEQLVTYARIAGTDWRVVSLVPATVVVEDSRHHAETEILLLGLLLAVGTVASLLLWLHIVRPISDIVRTAQAVAGGQSATRAPIRGPREIAAVAESLNRMLDVRQQAEAQIRCLNEVLEARVRERTAELEAANRELEAFAYSVSHDLRAPLRAIDGFSRILLEEYAPRLDAEGQRLCSVVGANTRRMGQLIDDLLNFSRLGRIGLKAIPVDMTALAESAFHEVATETERARVDFRLAPLPPAVGDPALLRQAWVNLLGNAVKFSARREQPIVAVFAEESPGEVVYRVRDNGAGFDMRYADKLFGVFQRLHGDRDFPGTGLGLALTQRIVQRHGGRIWGEGAPGAGATFSFTLQRKED